MCGRWRSETSEPTKMTSPGCRTMPGRTAVARRFAPIRWICIWDSNLRADLVEPAEEGVAGAGDQQLRCHRGPRSPRARNLHRVPSVTSSGSATASPPSATIWSTSSWHFSTGGRRGRPESHARREFQSRWPHRYRRMRPRRSRGRRAGLRFETRHQAFPDFSADLDGDGRVCESAHVAGVHRTALASSTSKPRIRLNSSVSATRASIRARCAPRQKCAPLPKLRSLSRCRGRCGTRRVSKTRSSRCADPGSSNSTSPSPQVVP